MTSSKRSTEADGLFLAGCGAVTLLFQVPLVQMLLDNPESLLLGVWNLPTAALFCALTFLAVPAAAGGILTAIARLSRRWAEALLAASFAFILSMQINFHTLQPHFLEAPWRKAALLAIWFGIAAAIWLLRGPAIRLLRACALFGPVVMIFFAAQSWPSGAGPGTPAHPPVQTKRGAEIPPVFFLTFEKICSSYVADDRGEILAGRFPNLARFTAEADYYPEMHANCTATVYSLKTLYSGRISTQERGWKRHPQIKSILGSDRQAVLQLDLLTDYVDPSRDVCLRAIGRDQLRGVDLISGWYKTYMLTIVPDPIELRLALLGWRFNPWVDMWAREEASLAPGEIIQHRVGRKQFELLKEGIRGQAGRPSLYIMHNFISDSPGVKASELTKGRWDHYPEYLEKARENLAVFDLELGKFFDFLRRHGLYDRSLIVVTSDTGYDYDSRRVLGDANLPLSRDLTRVFLAIKRPGQEKGRVFQSALRQVDVLPTILEHLGVDPSPYRFEGVPVTDPADTSSLRDRPLHFFLTSEQAGVLHYLMDRTGGPMKRIRQR